MSQNKLQILAEVRTMENKTNDTTLFFEVAIVLLSFFIGFMLGHEEIITNDVVYGSFVSYFIMVL